jgi:parallel beta-helix repeat protein
VREAAIGYGLWAIGSGLAAAILSPVASAQQQPALPAIELRSGLVVTQSARVIPKAYRLAAPASLDSAVITVRGDNITLDFAGASLLGQDPEADPDQARGVAIRIEGGRNVRVLNARIRGYQVGILARGTRDLVLRGINASYNWKPRLYSLVEHESLLDWLSFHQNEKDEWLRYGAAIYLDGVRGGELRGNTALQGMNGLLLVRSDSLRIQDNNFSFNSGLGIGLYRSSDNRIVRNRLDYDVRGYSHRFYHRGQDSAGLLLYEQSSRNLVAWNSATHGGDGLFLWAGQSTMDSGQGGANDNVFFGNDFSFAPANAMEATFSRNSFIANRAEGSDYGLWGGYSFESKIIGNCFAGNRTGIAIEHGQDNVIFGNLFAKDTTAINLWANPIEPSDWGYPKHRDTKSRDYRIERNLFNGNRVAVRAKTTAALKVIGNRYRGVDSLEVLGDTSGYFADRAQLLVGPEGRSASADPCRSMPPLLPEYARLAPDVPAGERVVPSSALARRGRSAMVVDEWGPFDWRSPKLWPIDSVRANPLRLRTLGPAGQWRVLSQRGLAPLSRTRGRIGDTITVTPEGQFVGDWELALEYTGGATIGPRGRVSAAEQPTGFSYGRFEPATDWTTRFSVWSDSTDPRRDSAAFEREMQRAPLLTRQLSRLDLEWYRPQIAGLPIERWALEANTTVTLPPGRYTLRTISDDGIRVWVDGALVIDRWSQHGSELDGVPLSPGRHELRVRFFQVDGWTELRVEILKS